MKRFIVAIGLLAIFSCSKERAQEPVPSLDPETYTLSIIAGKSGVDTKALNLDETTLNATWAVGDEVTVYKGENLLGTLTAQTAGSNTTLNGTLTGTVAVDDVLTLKFLSPDYASQDGTLTGFDHSIDKVCDYAVATVTVKAVDGSNNISIKETAASFENQQAIVKFVLYNNRSASKKTAASRLIVKVGSGEPYFLVYPDDFSTEYYVAIPGFTDQTLYLVACEQGVLRTFVRSGVSFENGKYYVVSVEVAPHTFTIADGERVYFSQGNLVYDGSKWYFHDNQYDRVHPEGAYATSYPMDLFCWGNVPNPAFNGEAFIGGMNYLSNNDGTDWGSNDIVNGGGPLPYWRTPWQEDLRYMLESRTNAAGKYALGRVAGVNGLIILPDDYAGTALNTSHTGWINNIDASSWVIYEAYGAVFLPTAGYRYGGYIIDKVWLDGQYWTATPTTVDTYVGPLDDGSYYLNIDADYGILWMKTDDRDEGRSVRLISDAS